MVGRRRRPSDSGQLSDVSIGHNRRCLTGDGQAWREMRHTAGRPMHKALRGLEVRWLGSDSDGHRTRA